MSTKKKSIKKAKAAKRRQPVIKPLVQEALQVTWLLKGNLKNIQVAYIRVGTLLAQVRDRKLWAELKHPDIETYAEERLQLRRSSLYKYLKVHDWLVAKHNDWLEPHPKGFIPELSDADDLMWIENELDREDLTPQKEAGLKELQAKALAGELRSGELAKWRRQGGSASASIKTFLSKLRTLRRSGAKLKDMPADAIARLDELIKLIDQIIPRV